LKETLTATIRADTPQATLQHTVILSSPPARVTALHSEDGKHKE